MHLQLGYNFINYIVYFRAIKKYLKIQYMLSFFKFKYSFDSLFFRYIQVTVGPAHRYLFSSITHPDMSLGQIGFSVPQRRWANISLLQEVEVRPFSFSASDRVISSISLSVDFNSAKKA